MHTLSLPLPFYRIVLCALSGCLLVCPEKWGVENWVVGFFVVYRHKMGERERTCALYVWGFWWRSLCSTRVPYLYEYLCDILLGSGKDDFENNATRMLMYIQRSYISTCIYWRCIYFVIQGFIMVCHKVLLSTFWYSDSGLTAASYCLSRPSQLLEKISLNIATDGEKYNVAAVFDI